MNKNAFQMKYSFTMKENEQCAEVIVYSEIASYKWWGDESTPKDFDDQIKKAVENGAKTLKVRVNSPGGEVFSAIAMRSMIMNSGFETVLVNIEGLCASAATVFACIPDAVVTIEEGSMFMIHNPSSGCWGTAEEMEKKAVVLRKMEDTFAAMYAARCGKEEDEIRTMMNETTWMTAEEAVEAGFCDSVDGAEPVAASVSREEMEVMQGLYASVADGLKVREEPETNIDDSTEPTVAAGAVSGINDEERRETDMDIRNMTAEQLREEAPELYNSLTAIGAAAERERIDEIDALTPAGMEAMAADCKKNGSSSADFLKMVVKAQKENRDAYLANREKETAKADEVAGASAEETKANAEADRNAVGSEIAKAANAYTNRESSGMM